MDTFERTLVLLKPDALERGLAGEILQRFERVGLKIVGMKIIWGFERDGDKWIDGKILDPASGNVYASSMSLIDQNTLKVRGYLGPFFRSQIWRRAP